MRTLQKQTRFQRVAQYTAIALHFLRRHWFALALSIIVIAAVATNRLSISLGGKSKAKATEKFTEQKTTQAAPSTLGYLSDNTYNGLPPIDEAVARAFLQRFHKTALGEQRKFGIPAPVILAYAYVNSHAGQRPFVEKANNLFALPCQAWDGPMLTVANRCVRQYANPWESFRDFSIFVVGQEWWGDVRKAAGKDLAMWIQLLEHKHLSDVDNASSEVRKVIERYGLDSTGAQ
jgi:flagellum-specific peptidoglycan hydrolase FlgJ